MANELGVPWRSAEAMHWALGEQEMAKRAGTTPFSMAASGYNNPANVSSSSSASGMERSGSYAPPESVSALYAGSERGSEEREVRRQRRPGHRLMMQPHQQPMHVPQPPQHLAPVGQGFEGPHSVVLPSLAEVTGGVPAFAPFIRQPGYLERPDPGRQSLAREQTGLQDVKSEHRGSQGSVEQEIKQEEAEAPRPQH